MRRIKTPQSLGRDYNKMLKDYFGRDLYGLDVENKGGHVQAQVVYFDYKHIDTVRRELAQIMPEVEFIKLKRDYTSTAQEWMMSQLISPDYNHAPVIYVQRGNTLVKTTFEDIANSELCQLELEEGDIAYGENSELKFCSTDDEQLVEHSWD